MATPSNVKFGDNYYGNGINSSVGTQNKVFFYDKAGIQAATADLTYQQFASQKTMPRNTGKEFRISVFHHIYDRMPYTDDTWNDLSKKTFSADFAKYGYLSSRDLADVTNSIYGGDGKGYVNNTYDNNGKRLLEGEGATNKLSIKKSTYTSSFELFGEMLEYTDQVEMFSEDFMQVRYRQELGSAANNLMEDLLQLDLLSTPNVIFSGPAISKETLGTGIGEGTPDAITGENAVEKAYKINFEYIQKLGQKLLRNRAKPQTSILKGSTNIGTTPIGDCYIAIVGPELKLDLENITRGTTYEKYFPFTYPYQYASQGTLLKNEIGRVNNFRFIYAERMPVERGAGAVVDANYGGNLSYSEVTKQDGSKENRFDVFPILIPCKDSFATIGLQGTSKIQFYSRTPSEIDKTDPFGQRGFFSYKFWYASIILHPEWLLKGYVLASA